MIRNFYPKENVSNELTKFGFKETAEIKIKKTKNDANKLDFDFTINETYEGSVYCWIIEKEGKACIIYVGQCSIPVQKRMRAHGGGNSGKEKIKHLHDWINHKGFKAYLYQRESSKIEIFGIKVPIHKTEEDVFINLWSKKYGLCLQGKVKEEIHNLEF